MKGDVLITMSPNRELSFITCAKVKEQCGWLVDSAGMSLGSGHWSDVIFYAPRYHWRFTPKSPNHMTVFRHHLRKLADENPSVAFAIELLTSDPTWFNHPYDKKEATCESLPPASETSGTNSTSNSEPAPVQAGSSATPASTSGAQP